MDNKHHVNKDNVLKCLKSTNSVLNKWVTTQGYPLDRINDQDVKSLFFGYVKRYLINYPADFKRFSKELRISYKEGWVSNIYILPQEDKYYFDRTNITAISTLISNLSDSDYKQCKFDKSEIVLEAVEDIQLSLTSIQTIKF